MDSPDFLLTERNRRKVIREIAFFSVIGLSLAGLLFVNMKYLPATFLWKKALNCSHLLLFMALGYVILKLVNFGYVRVRDWPVENYVKSLFIGAAFAVLSEWLQQFVGRELEFHDILLNLAGILILHGACYLWANRKNLSEVSASFKVIFFVGSVALIFVIFSDLIITIQRIFYLQRQLPLITSFEEDWELFRWEANINSHAQIVPDTSQSGQHFLKVTCKSGNFPGITLEYPPQDWRRYQCFSFEIRNRETAPFVLNVRIDDRSDGNSNRNRIYFKFKVDPGRQVCRIPFEEIRARAAIQPFDFSNVRRVVFFLNHPAARRVFHLDEIRFSE